MAPEIINKATEYHGIPVDLFSSAVILFIFMSGAQPFPKASPDTNTHYK
jgi:hypothetical protein